MNIRSFAFPILALINLLCLSSCMTTEVVEPDMKSGDNQLILSFNSPATPATRAHDGFRLRYVAKLFEQTDQQMFDKSTMQRQEIFEGETNSQGKQNEIIFDVKPGKYKIFLFADYVPQENVGLDNSDYYYNTWDRSQRVMFTDVEKKKLKDDFFNNDNYDCFWAFIDTVKTETLVKKEIVLQRAVSKVRLVDVSPNYGEYSLTVSQLGCNEFLDILKDAASGILNENGDHKNMNMQVYSSKKFTKTDTDKEILYFYMFADDADQQSSRPTLTFTVKDNNNGATVTTTIPKNIINKVRRNYITTATGSFLPTMTPDNDNPGGDNTGGGNQGGDNPGGENQGGDNQGGDNQGGGSDQPSTENGPIILDMSSNGDWNPNEIVKDLTTELMN